MNKIKVGIIGLGVGEQHIYGFKKDPRCEVVLISDTDPKKLKQVSIRHPEIASTLNPLDILKNDEIEAVSIASYDEYHHEQILLSLKHNKHVFVEKPLCLNRKEFEEILFAYKQHKNVLSSNLMLRKAKRFIDLKKRIERNLLGEIYYLEGDYDYGRLGKLTEGWRGKTPNYSVMHGGGIHLIDLLTWLIDDDVTEVFAYGNNFCSNSSRFKGMDLIVCLLKFSSGRVAKVSANFGSVTPHHHKVALYGTTGTFIQSHYNSMYFDSREVDHKPEILSDQYPNIKKGDVIPSFVNKILGEDTLDVSSEDVFNVMNVSLAVMESLELSKPVIVKKITL